MSPIGPSRIADMVTIVLAREGWGRAEMRPSGNDVAVAVRHKRCGALCVVEIDRAAMLGDESALVQFLQSFACYCVAPPPIPCEPDCTGRRCDGWNAMAVAP